MPFSASNSKKVKNQMMKIVSSIALFGFFTAALALGAPATTAKKHAISMKQATKLALAKEPGTIRSKELEHENGRDIYSFDIQTNHGIHEVNLDADTGAVVEDKVESPADEAKEAHQDKKHLHKAPATRTNPSDQ